MEGLVTSCGLLRRAPREYYGNLTPKHADSKKRTEKKKEFLNELWSQGRGGVIILKKVPRIRLTRNRARASRSFVRQKLGGTEVIPVNTDHTQNHPQTVLHTQFGEKPVNVNAHGS
jgi:hypothetical protein